MPIMTNNTTNKKCGFINDAVKEYSTDQEKLVPPYKTIKNVLNSLGRLKPFASIKLRRIDKCDRLHMPVYFCKCITKNKNVYPETWSFRRKSSYGKGVDPAYSKASALMEMAERFSCTAFLQNRNNFQLLSYYEAKNASALDISPIPISTVFKKDNYISSFLNKCPIPWVNVYSLTKKKHFLFSHLYFSCNTTGFAAGNSLEEAILQGLCEIIERHCIVTVTTANVATPSIDINSIKNSDAKKVIHNFQKAGIDLYIKDFSGTFRIPTIGIMAHDRKGKKSVKIFCAAGTSLNKNTALMRALTEICQHRALTLFHNMSKNFTARFPFYKYPESAICFTDSTQIVDFSTLPTYSDKNLRIEIEWAVNELRLMGLEVIAVNATHNVLKIPTAMVAIPRIFVEFEKKKLINPYLLVALEHQRLKKYREAIQVLDRFFRYYPEQYREDKKYYLYLYAQLCKARLS